MRLGLDSDQWIRSYEFASVEVRRALAEAARRQISRDHQTPGLSHNLRAAITQGQFEVDHSSPQYSEFWEFLRLSLADWVASVLGGSTPFQFSYPSIWAVGYGPGDSAQSHLHGPTCASWVFYLSTPEGSPGLTFDEWGITIPAQEGRLIIFPGWLWHSVAAHPGPEQRLVIAGNASIV